MSGTEYSPKNALPLSSALLKQMIQTISPNRAPVILCIGTDRIIGDSLGPLVGSMLTQSARDQLTVYGTLSDPVHALNLQDAAESIKKKHPGCMIIAVDASLGSIQHIGSVFLRHGGIHPGAGVCKSLPAVGDIAITGISGEDNSQPYISLQTARLSTVIHMAEQIANCIASVFLEPSL